MELMSKIEAILFLYGEELEVERLEKFFEVSRDEMVEALGKLKASKENTGINLKTKDGKVSLVTNPLYGEVLFNFFKYHLQISVFSGNFLVNSSSFLLTPISFISLMLNLKINFNINTNTIITIAKIKYSIKITPVKFIF